MVKLQNPKGTKTTLKLDTIFVYVDEESHCTLEFLVI